MVGYGILDKLDVKIRYSRMNGYKEDFEGNSPQMSYVSISPKYMLVDDILSVKLPIGVYIPEDCEEPIFAIAPALLASLPVNAIQMLLLAHCFRLA